MSIEAAMAAARAGDLPRAAAAAESVLARAPRDPNALQILGLVKWRQGRSAEALDCFLRASRAAPDHPPILNSLGVLYRERGDLAASRAALEKAVSLQPKFADALNNLAATLAAMGDDGADAAFERALALNPRHSETLGRYARHLESRHDLARARETAERALAVDAKNALALMTLADLAARAGDHAGAVAQTSAALEGPALASANRVILLGMRARALEKLGRYAQSFADSAAANAIMRAQFAESYAGVSGPRTPDTLARLEAFAREAPLSIWRQGERFADADPVFFVGFPRSGTTMLDQILSTFPSVAVLEEKENIQDSWLELLLAAGGLERWARLTRADIERLRAAYWRRAGAHVREGASLVIDKLPLDTALLGLIHLLFPKAKIIFALRDPRDVVLSCFQQTFGMNAAMYQFLDLETAGAYYDQVMRLGRLWRAKLPLVVHEVRYERVVAEFDAEIGALLRFLGLPWTDDLRKFHETAKKRNIRTPSARQVIQPLYASSVGKWRRYAAQLAPAFPFIDPWTEYFGYDSQI